VPEKRFAESRIKLQQLGPLLPSSGGLPFLLDSRRKVKGQFHVLTLRPELLWPWQASHRIGEAVARDVANLVTLTAYERPKN